MLLQESPTTTTFLDRNVQHYLGRYVQPIVRNALHNEEAGQMAEMRLVSTMFCHLPPFERVGIVVYQQVLTALQLLLSIHDGTLGSLCICFSFFVFCFHFLKLQLVPDRA